MTEPTLVPITYAGAGVDVEAGEKAVELMKESIRRAQRPEALGGLGGFAGLFDASRLTRMTRPVLATSTDGVGTKVAIAQALDKHDTIGYDLVGMVVDGIVVCGAEPLYLTDYIATGRVVPEWIAEIVAGIAVACAETNTGPYRGDGGTFCPPLRGRRSTSRVRRTHDSGESNLARNLVALKGRQCYLQFLKVIEHRL